MFIQTLDGVKNCKIHFYKLWAAKENRLIIKTSEKKRVLGQRYVMAN